MSRPSTGSRRRVAVVACALALLAVACTDSGEPEDYDTQTIQVDGDEVSLVEHNFTNSCEEANEGAADIDDPEDFCRCAYLTIKTEVPFDQFKQWDDAIRDDVQNPPPELTRLIEDIEVPCPELEDAAAATTTTSEQDTDEPSEE